MILSDINIPTAFNACFITGGAGSGKSAIAENVATNTYNIHKIDRVIYLATTIPYDEETKLKIEAHCKQRPKHWSLIEEPINVPDVIRMHNTSSTIILLECITLWLSNLIYQDIDPNESISDMISSIMDFQGKIIIVSNELGMGIVPSSKISRKFRYLHGQFNSKLAQYADLCIFVVSGIPVTIKYI